VAWHAAWYATAATSTGWQAPGARHLMCRTRTSALSSRTLGARRVLLYVCSVPQWGTEKGALTTTSDPVPERVTLVMTLSSQLSGL
jgi:hypothetical protein